MLRPDSIIIAVFDFRTVMLRLALLALTVVSATFSAKSGSILHLLFNGFIVCSDIRQKNIISIFKRSGITDVFTARVNTLIYRLGVAGNIVFQFDSERAVADRNSLSLFEQLAHMSESCGRHERIPLFVNNINILHVAKLLSK